MKTASPRSSTKYNKLPKQFNNYLKYSGLAIQMVVTIGVMAYIGLKIDQWLGIKFPAFLLLFTFLALGLLIYRLIKSVEEDNAE